MSMTEDFTGLADRHLTHVTTGDPFRLEPWQRRLVDTLQSGEPMRMLTPDEVRLRERRAAKRALHEVAARLRETR